MKRAIWTIRVAAVAAVLAGCGSGSPREDLFGPEIPAGNIVVETRHSGITEVLRVVIRTEAEWRPILEALGAEQPGREIRTIDFRTQMVILATRGAQREAGPTITFAGIQRVPGEVIVEVLLLQPDPRCDTVEIPTTPMVAAVIPRSNVPVRFVERADVLEGCP
jgi:hypothetical protein